MQEHKRGGRVVPANCHWTLDLLIDAQLVPYFMKKQHQDEQEAIKELAPNAGATIACCRVVDKKALPEKDGPPSQSH